jgi:hypothetical protein
MGRFGEVVEDIKNQLEQFQEWQMEHVPHRANEVADSLAKFELHLPTEQFWVVDFPTSILPRVLAEQDTF